MSDRIAAQVRLVGGPFAGVINRPEYIGRDIVMLGWSVDHVYRSTRGTDLAEYEYIGTKERAA